MTTMTNYICPSTKRLRLPFNANSKFAAVDGDLLVYRACVTAAQKRDLTDDDAPLEEARRVETLDAEAARSYFRDNCANAVRSGEGLVVCLSHERNWRRKMFPGVYKANRTGEKPVGLGPMRKWVKDTYFTLVAPELEADDLLGMIATHPETGGNAVIVSDDKDMLTLPGKHRKLSNPSENIYVERWQAELKHLYQTLIGDSSDGYKGAAGVGPKKAEAILAPFYSAGADFDRAKAWGAVVMAYIKADQDEADAVANARMAKILWWDEVDFNANGEASVRLWHEEFGAGDVPGDLCAMRTNEVGPLF